MQNDLTIINNYNVRPVGIRLGPMYIASYIRNENTDVQIHIQENRLRMAEGIPFNISQEIEDNDLIAISCMTNEFPYAYNLLKISKEKNKITVLGGIFPTANSDFVLNTGLVDYVVHGEGEKSFANLVKCLIENGDITKIKGISFIKGDRIINTDSEELLENIDILPAYDLINMSLYAKYERAPIMTSRGCPHSCTFCTLAPHWQRKYRMQSVDSVITQMKHVEYFGFRKMNIIDETFLIDRNRTEILLKIIIDKRNKNEMPVLHSKIRTRIDTIDSAIVKLLKEADIDMIQIGVETINKDKLQGLSKNVKYYEIEKKLEMILEAGISLNPIFIFGYNNQTEQDLKNDVNFIKKLGSKPNVTTYLAFNTPHPGSYEWKNARNIKLRILTGNINYYNHKMMVCIPESMGNPEYSTKLLQETFNETVKYIKMEHENPILEDLMYLKEFNKNLEHVDKIWF